MTPSGTAPPPPPPPSARSALADVLAALGIILCVGVADYLTGTDISLILFYLAPIGFGTWFVSLRAGLFLASAAVLVSAAADGIGGGQHAATLGWNGVMHAGTAVSLALVLAALRARLEQQERLARTDALTGIANRRAFFEAVALEIERTRRHGGPLTAAYVDCDGFKDVNDRRGHAEGDALLVSAAQTLRGATRAIDQVARLGGDEFGLLLPETDAGEAEALLARLQRSLRAAMVRHEWDVGFSIGAATFLEPPASADELLARADELMYAVKREAKGSVRVGVYPERRAPRGAAPSP